MHRESYRKKAQSLRRAGYSYAYIAKKIGVSKSTLYYWISDIPYKANTYTIRSIGKALARSGEKKSEQKQHSILEAQKVAHAELGSLSLRDKFMFGIGLYVGEGSKTNDIVRVVNSDPRVIRFAIQWFTETCHVPQDNLVMRLHIYPSISETEAIEYWCTQTKIEKNKFQKTSIDTRIGKSNLQKNVCPYGTAHVSVRARGKKEYGSFLARKIGAWMSEVLEYDIEKRA